MIGFDPMVEVVTLNAVVLNATELVEGRVWMIEVKLLDNFVQMQVRAWLNASAAECPGLQSRRRVNPNDNRVGFGHSQTTVKPATVVCERVSGVPQLSLQPELAFLALKREPLARDPAFKTDVTTLSWHTP